MRVRVAEPRHEREPREVAERVVARGNLEVERVRVACVARRRCAVERDRRPPRGGVLVLRPDIVATLPRDRRPRAHGIAALHYRELAREDAGDRLTESLRVRELHGARVGGVERARRRREQACERRCSHA